MSKPLPNVNAPRYKDGAPINVVQSVPDPRRGLRWYVNYSRNTGRHTCVYEEFNLVDHVRCKVCGLCARREDVPALARKELPPCETP